MLKSRIRNWVRAHAWFRQQGRAFSLEGRFRPKRGQEVEYLLGTNPPAPTAEPILIWDAWDLELAWRKISSRSRWALKYHYHDRVEPRLACILIRKFSGLPLRHQDWRDYMRIARKELADKLDDHLYGRDVAVKVAVNVAVNRRLDGSVYA